MICSKSLVLVAGPGQVLRSLSFTMVIFWQHHPVELDNITPQLETLQYLPNLFRIKIPVLYGGLNARPGMP